MTNVTKVVCTQGNVKERKEGSKYYEHKHVGKMRGFFKRQDQGLYILCGVAASPLCKTSCRGILRTSSTSAAREQYELCLCALPDLDSASTLEFI